MTGDRDERTLIARARRGERDAFRTLVERNRERMYYLALGHLRDHHDAEDALQEALLRAYRGLDGFRGESRLSTWLHRIVVNVCLDMERGREHGRVPLQDSGEAQARSNPDPAVDPLRLVESRDTGERIERAMARLTPLERSVFVLRHHGGLKLKEIAAVLDRREGTVKGMLFRAVRKLQRELGSARRRSPIAEAGP